MTILKNWVLNLANLWHSIKDENLRWQSTNHEQQEKLRQARILAEKSLEAELKKQRIQLEHDITLLKTKHDAELALFKTRCQQEIKDYRQYLAALDQLKSSIRNSYAHLPEAVVFTIHHHAKQLLNKMWECENFQEKMHYERQLLNFMSTVHEDARLHLEGETNENLPERTLSLLQKQ